MKNTWLWRLVIRDLEVSIVNYFCSLSPWLFDGYISMCSHDLPSLWVWVIKTKRKIERLTVTSFQENTKITTNWWTTIDKKYWNLPKNTLYTRRKGSSHNEMVGGALSWYKKVLYLLGKWSTNYKINILESSPTGVRVLSPMSGDPALGSGIGRRRPQNIWLLRPVGLEWQSFTVLGETETLLLEGTHKLLHVLGSRAKQWLQRTYTDLPEGLGVSLGQGRINCD